MTVRRRELRDAIHGFIYRSELEQKLIDSPVFQRLRRIRQLAMASLVYPGATHTRFDHSIGAMHVAGRIGENLGLDDEEIRFVRLAALLHDIGHGPFSHVSEPVLEMFYVPDKVAKKTDQQIHERLTADIVLRDESLRRFLSEEDREQIVGILEGSYGDSVLKAIVSGPLDADKQDYLLRDSYFCGVRYGMYDLERLSETLAIHTDGYDRYLALTYDGVHALEQFVLAKYYLTTQVYRHKIRLITDAMIRRALELGIVDDQIGWLRQLYTYNGSPEYVSEYVAWTDERLINTILHGETPNGYAKLLFQNLADRQLHKRLATYKLNEFADPLVREALSEFKAGELRKLEAEIAKYLGVDHNLVIVNIFSIKSVREQARNSEAAIIVLTAEGPQNFEQISTLFKSIDEAIQDRLIEVYAPVRYKDEKTKRRLQAQYKAEIKDMITLLAKTKAEAAGELPGEAKQ